MEIPPPSKPSESDCCGSGCRRCVFDIYEDELKIWKRRVQNTTAESIGPEGCFLSPDEYSTLVVTSIEKIDGKTSIYTLSAQGGRRHICKLGLGQHVYVTVGTDGESVSRPFTPINATGLTTTLRLLIKLYDRGKISKAVAAWGVGTEIQCRGPCGEELQYICNRYETLLLLASGTGITPMVNLIRAVLDNDKDDTRIVMLSSNQTYDGILLKEQLDKWSEYWNFHVVYHVTRDTRQDMAAKKKYRDKVVFERVTKHHIEAAQKELNFAFSTTFSYVCGSVEFETDMRTNLISCGADPDKIYRF